MEYSLHWGLQLSPTVYWIVIPEYCRRVYTFDTDAYTAPLDPYKIEWVDPSLITRHTNRVYPPWQNRWEKFGSVLDGDWDRYHEDHIKPKYFTDRLVFQAMDRHFNDDIDWVDTEYIQNKLDKTSRGMTVWHGCTRKEDVMRRCEWLDEVFEDIKESGYKTQKELIIEDGYDRGYRSCMANEISIDVARDGELLYVDGQHRLAIAKILDLDSIPVVFHVRHKCWMEYRDRCFELGTTPNHPDFKEIVLDTVG